MDEAVALAAGGDSGLISESDAKCYICLSPFDMSQSVASLETCQHVFCVDCILQWSQTSNTCPVDRISFSFVHQRRRPGGDIENEIRVNTQKRADGENEEEASDAVICEECGRSDRRHQLLVCIHCDSGYHMDCLTPSVNTGSEGDWICPDCTGGRHHTVVSMVEEEISDGELIDLLAEVDEKASPSSRLRPSTINRLRSTQRRRSTRLQSKASSNHNPHPQTCWHVPKYLLRPSRPTISTEDQVVDHHSDSSSGW